MQSGVGRTGKWWGHEHFKGAAPDIMLFAKGIASGFPFAGIAAKPEMYKGLPTGSLVSHARKHSWPLTQHKLPRCLQIPNWWCPWRKQSLMSQSRYGCLPNSLLWFQPVLEVIKLGWWQRSGLCDGDTCELVERHLLAWLLGCYTAFMPDWITSKTRQGYPRTSSNGFQCCVQLMSGSLTAHLGLAFQL